MSNPAPHNPKPDNPAFATVMVNYRAGDLILENLSRLVEQHQLPSGSNHIYIVDNNSQNGDAEKLQNFIQQKGFENNVTIIAHPVNGGFGAGNNVGLTHILKQAAPPEMIMFLNPDAHLHDDSLTALTSFLHQNPKAGFAGCSIKDNDENLQSSAFRFFSPQGEFEGTVRTGIFSKIFKNFIVPLKPDPNQAPFKCDWVSGAAFMARTKTIQEIGSFDEAYFLYFEETDLMKRGHDSGWETWQVPQAHAVHQEGFSTGAQGGVTTQKPLADYWYHSRNLYFSKHHRKMTHFLADIAWLKGSALYALRCTITRKPTQTPSQLQWTQIKNFIRLWGVKKKKPDTD